MRRVKYTITEDGDWVQPVLRGYKVACCDCGLVHVVDIRIRNGHVQFRAKRDNRATAARRRWEKDKR